MLAIVKQGIDAIIKNSQFKLPANNITLSTLEKFFLEKIESKIKADILFLYSLIREASGVKKVNTVDGDKNKSATIFLIMKNRKNH